MIGYSPIHKDYKCLLPIGKTYITRHVQFNESEFPFPQLFHFHKFMLLHLLFHSLVILSQLFLICQSFKTAALHIYSSISTFVSSVGTNSNILLSPSVLIQHTTSPAQHTPNTSFTAAQPTPPQQSPPHAKTFIQWLQSLKLVCLSLRPI